MSLRCTGENCPMQFGFEVKRCTAKDCPYRTEPKTNADRIRSMTDEMLASFCAHLETSWRPAYARKDELEWLYWLKQEVTDK